jgi:hypothetical protein
MYDVKSILDEQEKLIKKYNALSSILRALDLESTRAKYPHDFVSQLAYKVKHKMAKINEQIYLLNGTLKAQGDL